MANDQISNLGTGKGSSVIEMVQSFEKASGREVPYEIVERRVGDIGESWTSPQFAKQHLNWEAQYNLQQMCEDSWRWQQQNPDGNSQ